MSIRPEDYGGVTDPLADFANTSTMPGRGAGKAIDPSRPSLASVNKHGSTTDRIEKLEREERSCYEVLNLSKPGTETYNDAWNRKMAIRAELPRLRNEPASRGNVPDFLTGKGTCVYCGSAEHHCMSTNEVFVCPFKPSPPSVETGRGERIVGILVKELPTIQIGKAEAIVAALLFAFPALQGNGEAVAWHRREAKRLLNACSNQPDPIKARDHEDKAAWHEEAARNIEALYAAPPSNPDGVREALETAQTALQVWHTIHFKDISERHEVERAEKLLGKRGTGFFIGSALQKIRAALTTLPSRTGLEEAAEWHDAGEKPA